MLSDPELLRTFLDQRDEAAFRQLVERHIAVVHSAALRQVEGDAARAEEVTQQVFIELARRAPKLVGHPVLVGWLHRTARWKVADLKRAERRRTTWEQRAGEEWKNTEGTAMEETPMREMRGEAEELDWAQVRPLLDEAVDGLGEQDRDAVLLRFFENRPFAEIGTQLGLGENAARMRVDRALEKLRTALARRGVKSTAVLLGGALAANGAVTPPGALTGAVVQAGLAASTGVSTAAISGGFLLMTKLTSMILGAVVLGLASAVAWQWRENQQQQLALERQSAQRTTLEVASRRIDTKLAELEESRTTVARERAREAETLSPEQMERARLDLLVRKGELDQTHAALFRRLKLPARQLDELKTLIVERNQAEFDANKIAEAQGFSFVSAAERAAVLALATAEADRRIEALLGSKTFQEVKFFNENLNLRRMLQVYLPSGQHTVENDALLDAMVRQFVTEKREFPDPSNRESVSRMSEILHRFLVTFDDPQLTERAQSARAYHRAMDQLDVLLQEAALKGKLKNLSKHSARDYGVPHNPAKK